MMEDELVRRNKWLSRQRFLDLLGASHLIPGPNSTGMAIHIGYLWAGLRALPGAIARLFEPIVLGCAAARRWNVMR